MNHNHDKRICPVELSGSLDNSLRKLFQNPAKILSPYIVEGMTVLDLGCGPGFFTLEIARKVGSSGKVIAADLQEGMLNLVERKIAGTILADRIELHKCEESRIGVIQKADLILCFWMVHEVPDQNNFFNELKSILKPDGNLLIIEPKFHVRKDSFEKMIKNLEKEGFEISEKPSVFLSRAVLLTKN